MTPYTVSAPTRAVVEAYATWKKLEQVAEPTVMADGWTLPALHFEHLYEAQAAALDLAMISGSVQAFTAHNVLITEFRGHLEESAS